MSKTVEEEIRMKLEYERPYAEVVDICLEAIMTESEEHDNGYIDWGTVTNENAISDVGVI